MTTSQTIFHLGDFLGTCLELLMAVVENTAEAVPGKAHLPTSSVNWASSLSLFSAPAVR
jgi:hypothetical protein